jgi:hypothetical protein
MKMFEVSVLHYFYNVLKGCRAKSIIKHKEKSLFLLEIFLRSKFQKIASRNIDFVSNLVI